MKLNARLETAFELLIEAKQNAEETGASLPNTAKYARLFDVGCDHAYLSIEAVSRGLAETSFAMDVRMGPIEIARKNIKCRRLEHRIQTICTFGLDGIELLPGDAVTILGMGGLEICDIISKVDEWPEDVILVLQPMKSIPTVRETLRQKGLAITAERLCVQRGKLYSFIVAEPTTIVAEPDPLERAIGRHWLNHWDTDPLWPQLRDQLLNVARLRLNDPAEDHASLLAEIARLQAMHSEPEINKTER